MSSGAGCSARVKNREAHHVNTPIKGALRAATGLAVLGIAVPALAQEQDEGPAQIAGAAGRASSDNDATIVVTGTRLRRPEFTSPDPVTVIDPRIARERGEFTVAKMLQGSPIAAGSPQINATISSAFVKNGGVGVETVALRGLGASRTLVLVNGRRAGPAGTRGAIDGFDLNVMPQALIDRAEILKTGASSIYGSDAIAGVVNLITRTDTDGRVVLDGFVSAPLDSGGEEYRLNATWGKDFGAGRILASLEYHKREALRRGDRDYLGCPEEYVFDRQGNRTDLIDPRTGNFRCNDNLWGHVWVFTPQFMPVGLIQPSYGDNLGAYLSGPALPPGLGAPAGFHRVTFTPFGPAPSPTHERTALGLANAYHPGMRNATVTPENEQLSAYLQADYDVSDNLTVGTELLFSRRETETAGYQQLFYQAGFTTTFGDPFSVGWQGPYFISPTAFTDQVGSKVKVDYTRAVGWAKGQFGGSLEGWGYDAYVQYSRSKGRYEDKIIFKDAVDLHDLRRTSCAGRLTPVSQRPCVDINWTDPRFLYGDLNAAERNMLYGTDVGHTTYTQAAAELSANGTVIELPAGPLKAALGAHFRTDKINDVPGEQTLKSNVWGRSSAGISAGKNRTWEAFAEAEVPVIRDAPLIRSFTLSGSGRVTGNKAIRAGDGATDKDTGNWTYSVGASWEVTDWLRFRARYGTSFRAPALYEQFLSRQTSTLGQRGLDPCLNLAAGIAAGTVSPRVAQNCQAGTATLPSVPPNHAGGGQTAVITTGGGLGVLDPETSTARTLGVVLAPRFDFMPGTRFNLAVDYFDIRVAGEIATLPAAAVVSGCYSSAFFPSDPLCTLFTRRAAGTVDQFNIANVAATFININRQRNTGLDVTFDVTQDIGRLGSLQLHGVMTWQFKDEIELFTGTLQDNNGESGEPKWVGDFTLAWAPSDRTRIAYGLDVIGATSDLGDWVTLFGAECRTATVYGEICPDLKGEARFYHHVSLTQEIADGRFELTAGVSNLFDTRPPRTTVRGSNALNAGLIDTVGQSVMASQYDYVGRRANIGVRAKF